ncbi:MAG: purine-nucleoside/S-methyl-5-thioadenosine phosphorylase / adenosine deaminase [Acidimicrobiaceae bacterium]|nr:purine-nucleoside/S-methyl-5-thioadenosine phosphorylase / adenosine deaminase [Acidimicrobiaceae bacterium]MDQ1368779.1 purine-nucleoside/S-methyl-5-thioadenosine phosphorylase / adenosine deaminase [Acidimicrobiaceae bacterium]MDQ1418455.1 purine-nucleoside/S-methyl-5-thioadenosine phosphorylase / adenosine deaminase [Acidimicrobiaceae bacterium]
MIQLPTPPGVSPPGAPSGEGGPRDDGALTLGPAMVRFTGAHEGDMADPTGIDPVVRARRSAVVARPWSWLIQVHGSKVALVDAPGGGAGTAADAAVSATPEVALAVLTADCAPIAFASPEGVIGVAHAGWRGLAGGVIEETVASMRAAGARSVIAALGPCIHAECYPFGPADLDAVAARYGPGVRAQTSDGQPALDIPAAVRHALHHAGAELVADADICTSCSTGHWSWRARRDQQRQATVIWRP